MKSTRVQASSGNVFADLKLEDPEDRLAKARLAHRICEIVKARRLSRAKAAEILGLDLAAFSALLHGKLAGFSTERLFRCLNNLGQEIEITIRPGPTAGSRGRTRVVLVE